MYLFACPGHLNNSLINFDISFQNQEYYKVLWWFKLIMFDLQFSLTNCAMTKTFPH